MPNYIVPLIFDIRKIKAEDADMGVRSAFNLTSVDDNATATGNNQATAYQIRAANTYFSSAGGGGAGCVLPQTTGPDPLDGLTIYITNGDPVNSMFCYPNPRDPNNSINALGTNLPVVLGPNTITPFITFSAISEAVAGKWIADGIGAGAAGSIETIVSQGTVAASGTTAANSTLITQGMVQVTATATTQGVTLPPAKAGLQIVINGAGGGAASFLVWPGVAGTDTINALGAGASFTFTNPSASPTVFFCFNNGAWFTK